MMEGFILYKLSTSLVTLAIIIVILLLLTFYIKSYREIKIGFTLGLIFFGVFFLVHSICNLIFLLMFSIPEDMMYNAFLFMSSLIELIAFGTLYLITKKY